MATAIDSWIPRLEFRQKAYRSLIWMFVHPLKHLRPVSRATLRTRATAARIVVEATILGRRDYDAPCAGVLAPLLNALCQAVYVLWMKSSWELDA